MSTEPALITFLTAKRKTPVLITAIIDLSNSEEVDRLIKSVKEQHDLFMKSQAPKEQPPK